MRKSDAVPAAQDGVEAAEARVPRAHVSVVGEQVVGEDQSCTRTTDVGKRAFGGVFISRSKGKWQRGMQSMQSVRRVPLIH